MPVAKAADSEVRNLVVVPGDQLDRGAAAFDGFDAAVRQLYDTGWLHNHARMWVASYVVHLRRVHWRVGADWLYGHLLDGDLASNHLSWQWVAGTASAKPYLFNAANVAKYAPPPWHSFDTAVDASYEALDAVARDPRHRDILLLDYAEVDERLFGGWQMGSVDPGRVNLGTILRYSGKATLDPYATPVSRPSGVCADGRGFSAVW